MIYISCLETDVANLLSDEDNTDDCVNALKVSSDINEYLNNHIGKKPYKCNVCGKEFTESGNSKKHLRIHTCEKPYKCDVCGKEFVSSSNLKIHLRKNRTSAIFVVKSLHNQ